MFLFGSFCFNWLFFQVILHGMGAVKREAEERVEKQVGS